MVYTELYVNVEMLNVFLKFIIYKLPELAIYVV